MGHYQGVKLCPACSREYGDEHESCLDDGVVLVRLDTSTNARAQDLIDTVVDGRYRVERIVGRGGMGTVYACRHVVVGKLFAMKVLRPGIERSEEILQRFIREAQSANAVQSRHICEMTDFGQLANGAFYVVMELLDGGSLTRALREKRLDRRALKQVFIQIAETLFKAHNAGIIHRDLKPDNVVLVHDDGDPNFVKLVDFGIAKMMESKASNLTETGVILGTPYYMSPEQARGDDLDHRSDVYALGVMMYRAFTGRLPFVADTAMGVLTRHLTEKPELPSRITEMDPALERLILRCLEKKAIDRFQTMADVVEALRSLSDDARPRSHNQHATVDERLGSSLPDLRARSDEEPESEPTPTRLASPMAMSQRREAWDGSRAEASSAPVPRSQPPRARSNPPATSPIPALPPPPVPPPPAAPAVSRGPSGHPLPYPHHLTPQAFAQAGHVHTPMPTGPHGYGALPQQPYGAPSSDTSYPTGSGLHPVHQPVTGTLPAHPHGGSMEAPLPSYLQGESATNRGVSARISVLPSTPRRWPIFAALGAIALLLVVVGAVALLGNEAAKAVSPAASVAPDPDEAAEPGPVVDEPVDSPIPPATSTALSSPSAASATPSATPSTAPAQPTAPRIGPTPRPRPGGGDNPSPDPKPVDDVRDPFG